MVPKCRDSDKKLKYISSQLQKQTKKCHLYYAVELEDPSSLFSSSLARFNSSVQLIMKIVKHKFTMSTERGKEAAMTFSTEIAYSVRMLWLSEQLFGKIYSHFSHRPPEYSFKHQFTIMIM